LVAYRELPGLEDVYLEDSWVLKIEVDANCLSITLDLVLLKSHPEYSILAIGEQYCYRKGKMVFSNVCELGWREKASRPAIDANGEIDFGSIDSFEYEDGRYAISGEFGQIDMVAGPPVVLLANISDSQ